MKEERMIHSPDALAMAHRWAELDRKWLEEIQSEVHATDNPHLAPDYEPYSTAKPKVYGSRGKIPVIPAPANYTHFDAALCLLNAEDEGDNLS